MRQIFWYLIIISVWSCGDKEDKNKKGNGSPSEIKTALAQITLTSSTGNNSLRNANEAQNCDFSLDIYRGMGTCLTPLEYEGYARYINSVKASITDPNQGFARIAGVAGSTDQAGSIFNGSAFSLSDSTSFNGYNELWHQYDYRVLYDHLLLELTYEKVTFKVNEKFVSMLIVTSEQPFSSSDLISECNVPNDQRNQSRYQQADLLPGLSFKKGDYLFCIKDSLSPCESADYKWLNLTNNTLSSTRPENPRTHPYIKNIPINCSQDKDRISIGIPGIPLSAKLDTPFKLWADWSNGIDSKQWKDARAALGRSLTPEEEKSDFFENPYIIYYYDDGSGNVISGKNLSLKFDFNISDMIYIDGVASDNLSNTSIEEILAKVYTKHDWAFTKKSLGNVAGYGVDQIASITAKHTINLTE